MRLLAAVAWLWCLGCAAIRPVDPDALLLEDARVDFPAPDTGVLEFAARLPAPIARVDRVEWELYVDGHRFAAGLEGPQVVEGGLLRVRAPLAWRHLAWREGRGWLELALRGAVTVPGRRFTFRDRREVEVSGRPVVKAPVD